jgi:hypothetical protein
MRRVFSDQFPVLSKIVSGDSTNRKIFWLLWTVLSLFGYFLPFGWAIAEMFAALFLSWWIVYRSGML